VYPPLNHGTIRICANGCSVTVETGWIKLKIRKSLQLLQLAGWETKFRGQS